MRGLLKPEARSLALSRVIGAAPRRRRPGSSRAHVQARGSLVMLISHVRAEASIRRGKGSRSCELSDWISVGATMSSVGDRSRSIFELKLTCWMRSRFDGPSSDTPTRANARSPRALRHQAAHRLVALKAS